MLNVEAEIEQMNLTKQTRFVSPRDAEIENEEEEFSRNHPMSISINNSTKENERESKEIGRGETQLIRENTFLNYGNVEPLVPMNPLVV